MEPLCEYSATICSNQQPEASQVSLSLDGMAKLDSSWVKGRSGESCD